MSMLTTPTRGDVRRAGEIPLSGLLPLDSIVPPSGKFTFPPNWPPESVGFSGLGQPVSLSPGELLKAKKFAHMRERFQLSGMGQAGQGTWLSPSQVLPQQRGTDKQLVSHHQRFQLSGLGQPVRLPPWELLKAKKLARMRERFQLSGMGQWAPLEAKNVIPANYMTAQPQMFGMGQPNPAAQGTWLSPSQVNPQELESASRMTESPQMFGMGSREAWENRQVHVPSGRVAAYKNMVNKVLRRRGKNVRLDGMGQPNPATQGTWLSPNQLPQAEVESAANLVASPQRFNVESTAGVSGLGQELKYVDPTSMLKSSYRKGKLTLPEFKVGGKVVARYADPDPKVLGTAFTQGQAQLPGFYSHPTLGPWGVNPQQAYQYWWGQYNAMQRAAHAAPMAVWGSPGVKAFTPPPLPTPTVAQAPAYNPYAMTYPVAGSSVEQF